MTEAYIKDPVATEQKLRALVAERGAAKKSARPRAARGTPATASSNGNGRVAARVAARATGTRRARKPAKRRATARAR
jgi:hypothetical protein